MAAQSLRFDDFHLHGASAPEWDQRYSQLSPGVLRSRLTETVAGGVHLFSKWMSERVVQQGGLPRGLVCFAWLAGTSTGTARLQGHEVDDGTLFVLQGGEQFMLQRPPGLRLQAATLPLEQSRRLLDAAGWSPSLRALLSRPALRLPAGRLHDLHGRLQAALRTPAVDADAPARALLAALRPLIAQAGAARQGVGSASASHIVAECHRLSAARSQQPPAVDELCRRLRVSRRSLQNSFRQVAGTTALHYLRGLRLNAVRQNLLRLPPSRLSISQAAADQGFEHLGHFGQRYRALFGELPSQTARPPG